MSNPIFAEWLAHWGEDRLAETIEESQKCYRGLWERRNDPDSLRDYPAWELCQGFYWQESLDEWKSRWQNCGGRLCEGRMIAAKWDKIWGKLSSSFYDGLGFPYPPYARSSCANWREIDQDEAIVVGVISEAEFSMRMSRTPNDKSLFADFLGKDPARASVTEIKSARSDLLAALKELQEATGNAGGPGNVATRAERVAFRRHQEEESSARSQADYERQRGQKDQERSESNEVFRLLEEVENSLRTAPTIEDPRRWGWLCESVNTLTTTPYFDSYANWRARAWVASADLHRQRGNPADELSCLELALQLDSKLPIKRRISKLKAP